MPRIVRILRIMLAAPTIGPLTGITLAGRWAAAVVQQVDFVPRVT